MSDEMVQYIAGIMGIILVLSVISYIWGAICLQAIAKKTSTPRGWLAWIPFANIFLMVQCAGMAWYWALILCVFLLGGSATTQIGEWLGYLFSIACGILTIVILVRLCQACKKSGWLVLLLLVPVLGFLILMGILAFSKN